MSRLIVITGLPGSGKTTLAKQLAHQHNAVRMCPDDWMMSAGIDLWHADARARIEGLQHELTYDLLRNGQIMIIEWGVWSRKERDALRTTAKSAGASVELRFTSAPTDELWKRICQRDCEGRWVSRPIERHELEVRVDQFETPTKAELLTYDRPLY